MSNAILDGLEGQLQNLRSSVESQGIGGAAREVVQVWAPYLKREAGKAFHILTESQSDANLESAWLTCDGCKTMYNAKRDPEGCKSGRFSSKDACPKCQRFSPVRIDPVVHVTFACCKCAIL